MREDLEELRGIIASASLSNIKLEGFVPQKELLNDKRITAFIGHGGVNSIMECVYYGKPFLGFPIAEDQVGSSYRIERMGIGMSLRKNPSLDFVIGAIDKIFSDPDNNSYQKAVNRL